MSRGVRFSRHAAQALRRLYYDFRRQRPQRARWGRHGSDDILDDTLSDIVPFFLEDDEGAPFGAILEVQGWVAHSESLGAEGPGYTLGYFKCRKPGSSFQARYLVNIGGDTPANEFGVGSWAWEPTPVLVTEEIMAPQLGGSRADSWRLQPGLPGFLLLKTFDDQTALAIQEHAPVVLGVLDEGLAPGGSAEVSILSRKTGVWKKTTRKVLAYDFWLNESDDALEAGTKVRLESYGPVWIVTQAYCDPAQPAIASE